MPPGEQDQDEFIDNVAIRDVKVVFESGEIDIAVDLFSKSAFNPTAYHSGAANILFYIFLSMLQSRLPNLKAHLRRRIRYEVSICAKSPRGPLRSLRLIWIPITSLLILLLWYGRRW